MIYFDSSALVKRYVQEVGSDTVNSLLDGTAVAATSRLAYPEILSALTRRHNAADIETSSFERVKNQFKIDWEYFTVVEMRAEVLQYIDRIIDRYALRGADSIHLSTAVWLKQKVKQEVVFVASDLELLNGAKLEKLKVLNPQAG